MVQRHRRPGEVDRSEVGPARVEVGLDRAHPATEAGSLRRRPDPGQGAGGDVDGDDLRRRKAACQPQRAGARARTEVDDAHGPRRPICERGAGEGRHHPVEHRVPVVAQDLAVELEQVGDIPRTPRVPRVPRQGAVRVVVVPVVTGLVGFVLAVAVALAGAWLWR